MIIQTILDTNATSVTPGSIVSTDSRPVGKGIVTVEVSGTGSNLPEVNINGKLVYPVVQPMRNRLSYTADIDNSPGFNGGTDDWGFYWATQGIQIGDGHFKNITETNPFGGSTSYELSAYSNLSESSYAAIVQRQRSYTIDQGYEVPNTTYSISGVNNIFSCYVKKPSSNAASGCRLYIYDETSPTEPIIAYFEFAGGGTVLTVKATDPNITASVEDAGNDWYRAIMVVPWNGEDNDETFVGDELRVYFLGGASNGPVNNSQSIWLWAPQLEQWGEDSGVSATPYQSVVGNAFIPVDDTVIGWPVIQPQFVNIANNTTVGGEIDIYPTMSCTLTDNGDGKRVVVKIAYPDALAKK